MGRYDGVGRGGLTQLVPLISRIDLEVASENRDEELDR